MLIFLFFLGKLSSDSIACSEIAYIYKKRPAALFSSHKKKDFKKHQTSYMDAQKNMKVNLKKYASQFYKIIKAI